jgi:hypothetical protein
VRIWNIFQRLRSSDLPEGSSEVVKGETNQREKERDWWFELDGNIEVK